MACTFTKTYLLTTIRSLLNEKSSVKWTNDQLNKWIQEATIDISTKTLGYENTDTITTVSDTLEYDEPDGCIKIHECIKGGSSSANEWVQHLDDNDWVSNSPDVPAWGVWHDTYWTGRITLETRLALNSIGTWYISYRPTKVRVAFTTEGTAPTLLLYDKDAVLLVEEADYVTGAEVDISWGSKDIHQIGFKASNMNENVSVTNIEFYTETSSSDTDYRGLSQIHPRLIQHVTQNETGEPLYWYHHHNKIGVWPLPDDAYTITVYYSKITEDITDLPCELRLLAIPYCLAMARLAEGWKDDFEMFIMMYINSLTAHRLDRGQYKLNMIDAKDKFQLAE